VKSYISQEKIAEQFGVSRARVYAWGKSGAPLTSEKYLAEWLLDRGQGLKPSVREEAERIAGRKSKVQPVAVSSVAIPDESDEIRDELAGEVSRLAHAAARGVNVQGKADSIAASNERLAAFTDYYAARLAEATAQDDLALIKYWGAEYRAAQKVQQDGQLLAKKLGIDSGELMPKEQAERYLRAVAYWIVRCIDSAKRRLREKVVGLETAQAADAILDAELIESVLVVPMARATRVDGGTALPEWATAAIIDAIEDYVENGTEEVQRVLSDDSEAVSKAVDAEATP
jgi:hypothetical protein